MKKLYLDSDVLLDLLLDREPFSEAITELIEEAVNSDIKLYTSPISITNIHYIISRLENRNKADLQIQKVLKIVCLENVGQSVIDSASQSQFKDFEDSVQNYCAVEGGHQIIITRNTKDYKESELSILTPKEYLAKTQSE